MSIKGKSGAYLLPDDPALREYNAYLAGLAKHDAEKQNRTTA